MSTNISPLSEIKGFLGACLVDSDTGLVMVTKDTGNLDMEVAGAVNADVVKAKLAAIKTLNLKEEIEDILITLGGQFHLIRPLAKNPTIFIYVALDRKSANLGMARVQVRKVEATISI